MLWSTCCGRMLWVTLTYVVENMFTNVVHNMYPTTYPSLSTLYRPLYIVVMLWVYIVDYTYLCCGWHVRECCPQHVHVLHNIWHVVGCGVHWPFFTMFPTTYTHNIHPQHVQLSTTYTHNICSVIYCGCMLWRTTSTCCGAHMLWSATTFNDGKLRIANSIIVSLSPRVFTLLLCFANLRLTPNPKIRNFALPNRRLNGMILPFIAGT